MSVGGAFEVASRAGPDVAWSLKRLASGRKTEAALSTGRSQERRDAEQQMKTLAGMSDTKNIEKNTF